MWYPTFPERVEVGDLRYLTPKLLYDRKVQVSESSA